MNSQELHKPEPSPDGSAVIKVFGVGGGGCNALEQMIAAKITGVDFKCVNTDQQALAKYPPENTLGLGKNLTRGLGAGADPAVGRKAAEESKDEIIAAIGNADMLFLTAGMGGGTGTGAVSVIAKIARELGVLTVAVVTEPFAFEGIRRTDIAEAGLAELCANADSMIVVPNENLLTYLGPDVTLIEAFAAANDIVTNAVQSIAELITTAGLINVDFADVKSVMTEMGHAIMSTGTGMGENRAYDAALSAIESPLLNNIDLQEARGILANISACSDLSMGEFQIVGDVIRSIAADNANVVIGTVLDENLNYEMQVTVVATGLKAPVKDEKKLKEVKKIVRPPKAPKPKTPPKSQDSLAQVSDIEPTNTEVSDSFTDAADAVLAYDEIEIEDSLAETIIEKPEVERQDDENASIVDDSSPVANEAGESDESDEVKLKDTVSENLFMSEGMVHTVRSNSAVAKETQKDKKIALAGIVAGFAVLASVSYFVMNKSNFAPEEPTAVVDTVQPPERLKKYFEVEEVDEDKEAVEVQALMEKLEARERAKRLKAKALEAEDDVNVVKVEDDVKVVEVEE